jgi:hypothetical protein
MSQHWDGMVKIGTAVSSRSPFRWDRPTMTLKGEQFTSAAAFPNFYFHAAIAHGLLRPNGVEVGNRDELS